MSTNLETVISAAAAGDTVVVVGTCTGLNQPAAHAARLGNRAYLDGNHAGVVLTVNAASATVAGLTITHGFNDNLADCIAMAAASRTGGRRADNLRQYVRRWSSSTCYSAAA